VNHLFRLSLLFFTGKNLCRRTVIVCSLELEKIPVMKKIVSLFVYLFIGYHYSFAQPPLTVLPSGGNKKASVSERIGLTDVTIHYDRPGVKGREGKIWGNLVPVGFTDPGFGSSKAAPWRAGANENTTIEFSNDVKIEGKPLTAGKYGFFIAYDPKECTLIFSKNASSWGHFFYTEKEDALRVKVKPVPLEKSVEWLKYEFNNQTQNAATVVLQWEKLSIPFTIETNYLKDQVESFRRELRTDKGFMWEAWEQAANWCLQNNTNLEEALLWADSATGTSFGGSRSFTAWSTKAGILNKLGKPDEAAAIMKKALPLATMQEVHVFGRSLITQKKFREALDVFKMNYEKNPNEFTTLVGLIRGYSANGDFKTALKYAQQALPLAPDQQNKNSVESMIGKLKDGKDVN
jgi:tetratricopeptide (TPR) repeat protein